MTWLSHSADAHIERVPSRVSCLCAGLYAIVVFFYGTPEAAVAFDTKPTVFFNADACRASHTLSDSACAQAYANARAEFTEKAPRFSNRAECERHFHRCMIGDVSGNRRNLSFIPLMLGFRIDSGRQRQALPVAEGGDAGALFRPRAVDRIDSFVSAARSADAQKAWQALTSPAPAAAGQAQSAPFDDGGNEGLNPGPTQTYPVSPSVLKDMQDRERLYGGLGQKQ